MPGKEKKHFEITCVATSRASCLVQFHGVHALFALLRASVKK